MTINPDRLSSGTIFRNRVTRQRKDVTFMDIENCVSVAETCAPLHLSLHLVWRSLDALPTRGHLIDAIYYFPVRVILRLPRFGSIHHKLLDGLL